MATPESVITHVTIAAETATGKLSINIAASNVSQQLIITDVLLIISVRNECQVGTAVDTVEEQLIKQAQLKPARREGDRENHWMLLDYIDFMVYVQRIEERNLYGLEWLWKDCPQIPLNAHEVPVPQDDEER